MLARDQQLATFLEGTKYPPTIQLPAAEDWTENVEAGLDWLESMVQVHEHLEDLAATIRRDQQPAVDRLRPRLAKKIEEWQARKPSDRPAYAKDLCRAFESCFDGEEAPAPEAFLEILGLLARHPDWLEE